MKTSIETRDDLSFTALDAEGRMINWPRNNPGVPADWQKGMAFFNDELHCLASYDETEAFDAIRFAILGMGGRSTNLELGFIDSLSRAAVLGMRAMRAGADQFEPIDN